MRFLCLHGYGTSGAIFKRQCAAFMRMMAEGHEFVFADGPYKCDVHPDLIPFISLFPGPYHSWFPTYSPSSIAQIHDHLTHILTTLGPFDALIGFSQGGNLALSYLLDHAISRPSERYPVDFAIMISSGLACSSSSDFTSEFAGTWKVLAEGDGDMDDVLGARGSVVPERKVLKDISTAFELWDKGSFKKKFPYDSEDERDWPRPFHPDLLKERVRIPTVHVIGVKDRIKDMGEVMEGLCDETLIRKIRHGGGHELPKKVAECREWVESVKWAARKGMELSAKNELDLSRKAREKDDDWGYVTGELCII